MYYRNRPRSSFKLADYLMPFLIIISVGVIIVLGYNLWKSLFAPSTTGDAYMHIVSGNVQVKPWGAEEFLNLKADALIMQGDELRTSTDAKVILEFFDGTLMRVDGGSDVVLSEFDNSGDEYAISLLFVDGKLWFNKLYKNTGNTQIVITMENIAVNSLMGSIFEVENESDEAARVLKGEEDNNEIAVNVLTQDDKKVVETEKVRVGQEVVFTDKVLDRYWKYQSPNVIDALSDEFRQSDWYLWNSEEDKSPTQFSKSAILGKEEEFVEAAPEVLEPTVSAVEPAEVQLEETSAPTTATETPLTAPKITSVAGLTQTNADGFYEVLSYLAILTGTVSGASKIVVNGYTLQKFLVGDTNWTYYANANYDLMKEGENVYEIYALGPNGERSESIFVKVLYKPVKKEAPSAPAGGDVPRDEGVAEGPKL